jgi:DICT domain-containing protein
MPNFNIDPSFSVYGLVKRTQEKQATLSHRRTMTIISHEIENATLIDGANTVIFSGFQRLSKFLRQTERYERIAQNAKAIYVFGEGDVMPPPIQNVTYVPLKPDDHLVKEWFLVSYGQDYYSALATEELTSIDDPDPDRVFKGLWTYDINLVQILYEWLAMSVDMRPEMLPDATHDHQKQVQLMSNTIGRMNVRAMNARQSEEQIVPRELQALISDGLHPALTKVSDENNVSANA